MRRNVATLALGVAWCLVVFLPMSNILAFRNGPYGDYYLALPGMGLALAFGWGVSVLAAHGWRNRLAVVALALLGCWRLAAVAESLDWSAAWNDSGRILQRSIRTFPRAFSAMNEYARLHYLAGADDACQEWTARALAIAPHSRDAFALRALVAARRGDLPQAQRELDQFLQYGGSNESWGVYFQGYLLDNGMGDTNGAIRCYRKAVACRTGWTPDVLDAMSALAFFAVQRGDRGEAIKLWEQVVQVDPLRRQVRQNLMRAYLEAGDNARAQAHWLQLQRAN